MSVQGTLTIRVRRLRRLSIGCEPCDARRRKVSAAQYIHGKGVTKRSGLSLKRRATAKPNAQVTQERRMTLHSSAS
jgi:hypothetical protein